MTEQYVEYHIREYLKNKGWKISKEQKKRGEHGVDIQAWHPKWRKILLIEVKGGSGKHIHQERHGAFYDLGQSVSRMNIEGNHAKRAKIYAFGIPYEWVEVFKKKIRQMKYGWSLLKLRGFLVKENLFSFSRLQPYFICLIFFLKTSTH